MSNSNRAAFIADLRRAIEQSYTSGAAKIATRAKLAAPILKRPTKGRKVGALKRAIGVEHPNAGEGRVTVRVGVDSTVAPYARFQESGYTVRGRERGSASRFLPGARFMRDAFNANRTGILNDVERQVREQVEKANK